MDQNGTSPTIVNEASSYFQGHQGTSIAPAEHAKFIQVSCLPTFETTDVHVQALVDLTFCNASTVYFTVFQQPSAKKHNQSVKGNCC